MSHAFHPSTSFSGLLAATVVVCTLALSVQPARGTVLTFACDAEIADDTYQCDDNELTPNIAVAFRTLGATGEILAEHLDLFSAADAV